MEGPAKQKGHSNRRLPKRSHTPPAKIVKPAKPDKVERIDSLTVYELKTSCKQKQVDYQGNKAELQTKLKAATLSDFVSSPGQAFPSKMSQPTLKKLDTFELKTIYKNDIGPPGNLNKGDLVIKILAKQEDSPKEEVKCPITPPKTRSQTPPARASVTLWKPGPSGVYAQLTLLYPSLNPSLHRIAEGPSPQDCFGYLYAYHEPQNNSEFKIGRSKHLPERRIKTQSKGNKKKYLMQKSWDSPLHKLLESCVHIELKYCRFTNEGMGKTEWFRENWTTINTKIVAVRNAIDFYDRKLK